MALLGLFDSAVFVDASSAPVTVTLPTAVGNEGKKYYISKRDVTANAVIIDPDGSETINGDTDATIGTQYNSVITISDGTEWGIF